MVSQELSWSEDEILKKHISILKKKKKKSPRSDSRETLGCTLRVHTV